MPTPIMATASTRPATMNIVICSIGTSSGWRAAPSRNLPPSRPKPIAVPSAPMPIRIATATAVMPCICANLDNAPLQLNDQDMEYPPAEAEHELADPGDCRAQPGRPAQAQREQCDQDEDQLAGVHVAE